MPRIKTISKNLAAFLDMLAYSEGTDYHPKSPTKNSGYDVIVGHTIFTDYSKHPNVLVPLPKLGIKSTAAGRYQLLYRYWLAYSKLLNLKDFSPLSQDLIAIQQIKERRAIALIEAGDIEAAIKACSNIWASLPGAGYNQYEHSMKTLVDAWVRFGGVRK